MIATNLRMLYQLRVHRLGPWPWDRWGVTLAWGAAGLLLLRWIQRGQPILPAWHWLVLGLLIATGGALLVARQWAAARAYVVFEPQEGLPPPPAQALDPADKLPLRATGRFEVQGKLRFFADLLAYWRTFATREHTIMAIAHPSRFLLLGTIPENDLGMWYIFFRPEETQAIAPGRLSFGAAARPALRVTHRALPAPGRKRRIQPVLVTTYLAFDDEATRAFVWADLLADAVRGDPSR